MALFGGDCSTETDQPRAPVDHRRSVADVQSVAVAELTGRGSTTDTHLEVDATATALVAVGATRRAADGRSTAGTLARLTVDGH